MHPEKNKNITKIIISRNIFGDDVNQDLPDMSLLEIFGRQIVPPKNIKQCYCEILEI